MVLLRFADIVSLALMSPQTQDVSLHLRILRSSPSPRVSRKDSI